MTDAEIVTAYMQELEHPLKAEIVALRTIIKSANRKVTERIKWDAPNYFYKEDLITFNLKANKIVHIVLHNAVVTGVKSPLLEGDHKDRRMVYFHNMDEIKSKEQELKRIINGLVEAMDRFY
jgi:hypothetical protein